jgi:hypothetical protein
VNPKAILNMTQKEIHHIFQHSFYVLAELLDTAAKCISSVSKLLTLHNSFQENREDL